MLPCSKPEVVACDGCPVNWLEEGERQQVISASLLSVAFRDLRRGRRPEEDPDIKTAISAEGVNAVLNCALYNYYQLRPLWDQADKNNNLPCSPDNSYLNEL